MIKMRDKKTIRDPKHMYARGSKETESLRFTNPPKYSVGPHPYLKSVGELSVIWVMASEEVKEEKEEEEEEEVCPPWT